MRLADSVVGPIVIAQGSNAPAQTLDVVGLDPAGLALETGALRLTFSSTAPWVSASASAAQRCSGREGDCISARFNFSTQQLPAGSYSATVTIADPNALDAPQNVLVLLRVGSTVPERVNLFVPPDGSEDELTFYTNSSIETTTTTQSGGSWLSVTFSGVGSFAFVRSWRVAGKHLQGLAEGTYTGAFDVRGSSLGADNRSVPVSLRVTSEPIAKSFPEQVRFRVAENSVKPVQNIRIGNRGRGTLTLGAVTASTSSGGNWLTAARVEGTNFITLTADPAGVAAGVYRGSVVVASNAVNGNITVPVELEVIAQAAPAIRFQGVLDNAVFEVGDVLGAGGIVAAFGEHFSYREPQVASSLPLPQELGDARVFVNDRPAPIYFSSYGQINFQIPYDTPAGEGTVRIDRGTTRGNTVTVRMRPAVPKLIRLRLRDAGVNIPEFRDFFAIAVNPDGTLSLPREFGIPNSRPSRIGETIVIYALGAGATDPPVTAGQAAPGGPLASVASNQKTVYFGALALNSGAPAEALYAGLTPGFVGLYQINVTIPAASPLGDVPVRIQFDTVASEYGLIAVE